MNTRRTIYLLATCLVLLVAATKHESKISSRQNVRWQDTPDPTDPHDYVPSNFRTIRVAHAVLMSTVCLILFPLGALLSKPDIIRYHIVIQMLAFWIFVAAAGMGIWMAKEIDQLSNYHPILGLFLLFLLATQPITELLNLIFTSRRPKMIVMAHIHYWLGRGLLAACIIQGGLGFVFAASFSNAVVQPWPRILYGVVAVIAYLTYTTFGVIRPVVLEERGKRRRAEEETSRREIATRGEMDSMGAGAVYSYDYGYGYGQEMRRF